MDERSSAFLTDPQVREYEGRRVLCKICETWVAVDAEDDTKALQTWLQHRTDCLQTRPATSANAPPASIPSIDSVPPPSKHLMALVSSSSVPAPPAA